MGTYILFWLAKLVAEIIAFLLVVFFVMLLVFGSDITNWFKSLFTKKDSK